MLAKYLTLVVAIAAHTACIANGFDWQTFFTGAAFAKSIAKLPAWDAPEAGPKNAPSGTYHGSKSVLGIKAAGTITIDDTTHADLQIKTTGLVSVNIQCPKEEYFLSGNGQVTLPTFKSGDCVYDALKKYHIKLKGIFYDDKKDTITLSVHAAILNLKIVLSHNGVMDLIVDLVEVPEAAPENVPSDAKDNYDDR